MSKRSDKLNAAYDRYLELADDLLFGEKLILHKEATRAELAPQMSKTKKEMSQLEQRLKKAGWM